MLLKQLPHAFTEHGVAMLASVLRSEKAINMSRDRLGEHDVQLNGIYDAIENLLDERTEQKKWQDRERIGFKK